jgi:Fe2+-dicitrate sensor, membrane component
MSRSDAVTAQRQNLLREAAHWLSRLDQGQLSTEDEIRLQEWCRTSAEHERVWRIACDLNRDFNAVPSPIARTVLDRPNTTRRTALKSLMGAGALLPLAWYGAEQRPWQPWLADYRTATGEFLTVNLADGIELLLNTATAVAVEIAESNRRIHLHHGEVLVRMGADPAPDDRVRSLSLITAQGSIWTLGSEFAVRCLDNATQVTVAQESVRATPRLALQNGLTVLKDQQCRFTGDAIVSVSGTPADSLAWQRGQLIADEMPLRELIAELNRYRHGTLRCDDAIAALKVSGVFQLNNTDQAIEALADVLHLQVKRYTDYWVRLSAS